MRMEAEYHNGVATIVMRSPRTGLEEIRSIFMTPKQFTLWYNRAGLVQEIFPDFDADTREWLISGYTAADWEAMFPPEEASEWDE